MKKHERNSLVFSCCALLVGTLCATLAPLGCTGGCMEDDGDCGELSCLESGASVDCPPDAPDCVSTSTDERRCDYPPPQPLLTPVE